MEKNSDQLSQNISTPHDIPQDIWYSLPWSVLQFKQFALFQQYFTTGRQFSTSLKFQTYKSTIFIDQSIVKHAKDKKSQIKVSDRINLYFKLNDSSLLWSKITEKYIKFHYTLRNCFRLPFLKQSKWSIYTSFSSNRFFQNCSFIFGAASQPNPSFIDLRLRLNCVNSRQQLFLYSKGRWDINRFSFGFVTVVDYYRKLLQKNDINFGFKVYNNGLIGVNFQNDGFRTYRINYRRLTSYFDVCKLIYVQNVGKWKGGIYYDYNIQQSQHKKVQLALAYIPKYKLQWLKFKINSLMQIAIASSIQLNQQTKIKIGLGWGNILKSYRPKNYILQINYNKDD